MGGDRDSYLLIYYFKKSRTYSCEDCGGEEDRLQIVPVLSVVLSDDVYPGSHHLTQGGLVLAQQFLNTDRSDYEAAGLTGG